MTKRLWILGAADPEMNEIENLLRATGEAFAYALDASGERVSPATAYKAVKTSAEAPADATVYLVECEVDGLTNEVVVRIDHHRPGDPGYGQDPREFLAASSVGQVLRALARLGAIPSSWRRMAAGYAAPLTPQYAADGSPVDYTGVFWLRVGRGGKDVWDIVLDAHTFARVPSELVLAAAADHCLAAAYRGECPGVDPDALMRWRAETRAAYQKRSVADVLADVEKAREALRGAPLVELRGAFACDYHAFGFEPGCGDCTPALASCDLRGRTIPELPEAAAREGVAYLATVADRDGRKKIVLGGHTTPETVKAFIESWAPAQGLTGIYGDPARGFAGGDLP